MSAPSPSDHYRDRLNEFANELKQLMQQSNRLSWLRGAAFFPAAILAIATWQEALPSPLGYVIAGGFFLLFIVLAGRHEGVERRRLLLTERTKIYEQHQARLARDFDRLPDVTPHDADFAKTSTARDLDLFGSRSVFQWLCLAQSELGRQRLGDWLDTAADIDEIRKRQAAVQQLAPMVDVREEIQIRGRMLSLSPHGPEAFLNWAEEKGWLASRPWLNLYSISISVIFILLVVGIFLGFLPQNAGALILIPIVANLIVNLVFGPNIHKRFDSIASRQDEVTQYRSLIQVLDGLPGNCDKFTELKERMRQDGDAPLEALDDLAGRVRWASARRSAIGGLPYLVGQFFFVWDVHVLRKLEHWQRRHGRQARAWFECLADFEALVSLSGVAFDEPDWCFPDFDSTVEKFTSEQLAHPLIPADARVANDVEIGPKGSFLLVTGSNMSGKSTLLRSVGVNVALAQAGGPVCAVSAQLPKLRIATSMRVGDSLADGVSFYMAELQRLKEVVDEANAASDDNSILLYLLDEILLGTNSAERHIAVVQVVRHLLDAGAIGAISTHDLELADSETLLSHCHPVHFREKITTVDGEQQMTFDYQMREGVATTTNALKLLEMVGLRE